MVISRVFDKTQQSKLRQREKECCPRKLTKTTYLTLPSKDGEEGKDAHSYNELSGSNKKVVLKN